MIFKHVKYLALSLTSLCVLLGYTAQAAEKPVQIAAAPAMSTAEMNKAKTRQFYDVIFNQHKAEMMDQFLDAKAVDHDMPAGATTAQIKEMMKDWLTAFPDFSIKVLQIAADGDLVMCRYEQAGTFKANFMGIAPTNKKFKITAVDVIRLSNGKMVEHWSEWDHGAFFQQLGLKPEDMAKMGM